MCASAASTTSRGWSISSQAASRTSPDRAVVSTRNSNASVTADGERDVGDAAEAEFATPAANDEALNPAAGASRLHVEIQAVAVDGGGPGAGADEGGVEGGMASSALGSTGCVGGLCLSIHPSIIYANAVVSARHPDRDSGRQYE